jgi:hypothetical protein
MVRRVPADDEPGLIIRSGIAVKTRERTRTHKTIRDVPVQYCRSLREDTSMFVLFNTGYMSCLRWLLIQQGATNNKRRHTLAVTQ